MEPKNRTILTNSDLVYEQHLAELVAVICDRISQGDELELEEVCREHPEYEVDLRDLWGTILLTQSIGIDAPKGAAIDTSAAASRPLFELPYRMGGYMLREEIGRGGMGVVFRADRISDKKPVAIKMMLKGEMATRVDRERFEAEARAVAGMKHPSIIPIYDVGEHMARPWFAMELIGGQTLASILANGPITGTRAAEWMRSIADAVEYAHSQGVLHRDLKPSNILIDENDHAWVCDFGLAKNAANKAASLTKTGAVLGTPAYMAPEQAAGARGQVGPVSDVYGLGAILYHMLTGRPPFQAATPVDTVLMVLEQDPIMPRVLNRQVDRNLEIIALRCLQKPQDLRYPTAAALRDDLQAFLEHRSVSAAEGRFVQVISGLFRETHHAVVLENWGTLWVWHSLVLLVASVLTNILYLQNVINPFVYEVVWGIGFGTWAAVFWWLRRRMGPVTFVERQIAHVWAASLIGVVLLFPFENFLDLPLLRLAPILAIVAAMAFLVKAGMLSGSFYFQVAAMILTSVVMALVPDYAMSIFGVVCGACFFFPGMKYRSQRIHASRSRG